MIRVLLLALCATLTVAVHADPATFSAADLKSAAAVGGRALPGTGAGGLGASPPRSGRAWPAPKATGLRWRGRSTD